MSQAKRYSPDDSQLSNFKIGLKGILLFMMPIPVLVAAVISLVGGNFQRRRLCRFYAFSRYRKAWF